MVINSKIRGHCQEPLPTTRVASGRASLLPRGDGGCAFIISPTGNTFIISFGLTRQNRIFGLSFERESVLFDKMSDALLQWCVDQLNHKFGLEACEDIVQ